MQSVSKIVRYLVHILQPSVQMNNIFLFAINTWFSEMIEDMKG